MISILIFCHKKREANILHNLCGYCTALMGDERLDVSVYYDNIPAPTMGNEETEEHTENSLKAAVPRNNIQSSNEHIKIVAGAGRCLKAGGIIFTDMDVRNRAGNSFRDKGGLDCAAPGDEDAAETFWVIDDNKSSGRKEENIDNRNKYFSDINYQGQPWDMIFFEVKDKRDLLELKEVRKLSPESPLLIITDTFVPPEHYLLPCIRPSLVLTHPYDKKKALDFIKQIYFYYYEKRERDAAVRKLIIRCGEEKRFIDYVQISYLEAREKKLVVHCGRNEVSFYGSLKEMEKILPVYFVRCHRSFIVNFMYVRKINISQRILCIDKNNVIPISNKYKDTIYVLLDKIKRECI